MDELNKPVEPRDSQKENSGEPKRFLSDRPCELSESTKARSLFKKKIGINPELFQKFIELKISSLENNGLSSESV